MSEDTQLLTMTQEAETRHSMPWWRRGLLAVMLIIIAVGSLYVTLALTGVCGDQWSHITSCPADAWSFMTTLTK